MKWLLIAATACLLALPARALEVLSQGFNIENGVYELELDVRIEAPIERVWAILTDYERLPELNPAVTRSGVEVNDQGQSEVLTVVRGCVLFFCNSVERVEIMEEFATVRIVAVTDPARSDLRQGRSEWNFWPEDEATRLSLTVLMEPDFWVPPVLGRRALRRNLIGGTLDLLEAVEHRAAEAAADANVHAGAQAEANVYAVPVAE